MIDLELLRRAAESGEGDRAVVERSWLRQAFEELTAGREAQRRLGECFGLPQGKTL